MNHERVNISNVQTLIPCYVCMLVPLLLFLELESTAAPTRARGQTIHDYPQDRPVPHDS